MDMKWVYAAIIILCLSASAFLCMLTAQRAGAGIGPAGFAYYAKQGILHGEDLAYGKGNHPWNVNCLDHVNWTSLTNHVTCDIKIAH